jgi:hypothetical protein
VLHPFLVRTAELSHAAELPARRAPSFPLDRGGRFSRNIINYT